MSGEMSYLGRSFRITPYPFLILALVAAAQPCRADDADKSYAIRLSHPSHVGEKLDFSCKGWRKIHNEVTVTGRPPINQAQEMAVAAQGMIEVLAVDAKGGGTKLVFTVKKFVRTDRDPQVDVLPAGAVVTAEAADHAGGEKTHFTLAGGELTADQIAALQVVLSPKTPDKPTDDETFGTDKPQKIGAVWPVDKAKLAEVAKDAGLTLKPEDIIGQSTLVAVMSIDGKEYVHVKAEFSAQHIEVPLPGGMKTDDCKMDAKFSGHFPTDGSKNKVSESMEMTIDMHAKGTTPTGGAVAAHTIVQMHAEREMSSTAP